MNPEPGCSVHVAVAAAAAGLSSSGSRRPALRREHERRDRRRVLERDRGHLGGVEIPAFIMSTHSPVAAS